MVDERLASIAVPTTLEESRSEWPHYFRLGQTTYCFTAMGDLVSKSLEGEWRIERVFSSLEDVLASMQPQSGFFSELAFIGFDDLS